MFRLLAVCSLWLVLGVSTNAAAFNPDGGLFVSDFEGPGLLQTEIPSGPWAGRSQTSPLNTFLLDGRSRKVGSLGARWFESGEPIGSTWSVVLGTSGNLANPQLFARTWLRVVDELPRGASWLIIRAGSVSVYVGTSDVSDGGVRGVLSIAGNTGAGFESRRGIPGALTHGAQAQWHLVEVEATGLATDAGTWFFSVDGVVQVSRSGVDLSAAGLTMHGLVLGMPHADSRTYRGSVDFDEVWAGSTPLPQRALITGPTVTDVGACLELSLRLVDPHRVIAPAPVPIAFFPGSVDPQMLVYASSGCRTPSDGGAVVVEQGETEKVFSVQLLTEGAHPVTAGSEQLLADPDVFLIARAPLDAGLDAGQNTDAGQGTDAGLGDDAGLSSDAGLGDDAGPSDDAGLSSDAGLGSDAGLSSDAGLGSDAGSADPDRVLELGCGCGASGDLGGVLLGALIIALRRVKRRGH